jgi:pimeloyl-ACP methyl ester carboxylesterase
MSGSSIAVDYEELHRMSRVWSAAARSLAWQAAAVTSLAGDARSFTDAILDPLGALRVESRIVAAALGPHGLATLAERLGADALALDAVVLKEQLVDDFPLDQLAAVGGWLVTAPLHLPFAPRSTLATGRRDLAQLAQAGLGYASPFTELLLAVGSPSPTFKADLVERHPLSVEPLLGLPLDLVAEVAPEGPGYVSTSRYVPQWSGTVPGTLGSAMRRVADLESWPEAALAVERVTGADGVNRFLIELPGMRHLGVARDPLDLSGAVSAMALPATAYTRCVSKALDAAGVPPGADVALVGHSEGGIVAMDLAADPHFNGARVRVTHVVVAGAPVSSKHVAAGSGTRVFSIENVNDIVTHLDAVDSGVGAQSVDRLTYQFSADRHDVVGTHDPERYAARIDALDGSPNPLLREFERGVAPYLRGSSAQTTVFAIDDGPPR